MTPAPAVVALPGERLQRARPGGSTRVLAARAPPAIGRSLLVNTICPTAPHSGAKGVGSAGSGGQPLSQGCGEQERSRASHDNRGIRPSTAHPLRRGRLLQRLLRHAVLAGLRAKTGRAGLHGAPALLLLAAEALRGLVRRLLLLLHLLLVLGVAGVARVIGASLLLICRLRRSATTLSLCNLLPLCQPGGEERFPLMAVLPTLCLFVILTSNSVHYATGTALRAQHSALDTVCGVRCHHALPESLPPRQQGTRTACCWPYAPPFCPYAPLP